MTHKTKLIEKKILSDGAIAVRVRCCDDDKTDSWRTIYVHELDENGIKQHVTDHHADVQRKHAAMVKAVKLLEEV